MTVLLRDTPLGELSVDTESRIARFYPRTRPWPAQLEKGITPWQIAWERGDARFHTFFRWSGGRDSPWLMSRTSPVVFLIPRLVGELSDVEFVYENRRKTVTFQTNAGRYPFYLESGTLEWSKARKLFLGFVDPQLSKRIRIDWLSHRGRERLWQGTVTIDDKRLAIGDRHNLNLSVNVYLSKDNVVDCIDSTDSLIRSLSLLDRRLDQSAPARSQTTPMRRRTDSTAAPICCDACERIHEACLTARRRIFSLADG